MLSIQLRQMLQVSNLKHFIPDRFLMQPQSLNLAFHDADHFDAAESGAVLAGEVREARRLFRGVAAGFVVRVENVDPDPAAFAPECQNVREHRPFLAVAVRHADRPVLPGNVAKPAREGVALHFLTQDRFFPCVGLPSEFAVVAHKEVTVPQGRFLADLDEFWRMDRFRPRVGPLPADARVLLASARRQFVDFVAIFVEQLVYLFSALRLNGAQRRRILQNAEQLKLSPIRVIVVMKPPPLAI
jgi:hypothetical protein